MTKPCPPDLAAFKHEPADYEQPVEAVTVEQIEVTQADRELASELLALDGHCFSAELVLEGAVDDWPNVQAIARHRHRTQANETMREALAKPFPVAAGYAVLREAELAGPSSDDWVRISPTEARDIRRAFAEIRTRIDAALSGDSA